MGKGMHMLAFILVIVGGLNWLLFGLFGWDIGVVLGGMNSGLSRVVYVLVGLGALYLLFTHKKDCKMCSGGMMGGGSMGGNKGGMKGGM